MAKASNQDNLGPLRVLDMSHGGVSYKYYYEKIILNYIYIPAISDCQRFKDNGISMKLTQFICML